MIAFLFVVVQALGISYPGEGLNVSENHYF